MSIIKSIAELTEHFPDITYTQNTSWNSACPFCAPSTGTSTEYKGNTFVGVDRFVWYVHQENPGFYCRHCGYHPLKRVVEHLGFRLDPYIEIESNYEEREPSPLSDLWMSSDVKEAHQNVKRAYWKRWGWTDELIDKFQLGYGELYGKFGHIIPMRVTNIDGETTRFYYIAKRSPESGGSVKTPGSPKPYYWMIPSELKDDYFSDTAILVEGEKDAITAHYLFPEFDIYASFGANMWSAAKTAILAKRHSKLWVFGDNDEAGEKFNRHVYGWAKTAKKDSGVQILDWKDMPAKADMTDLLDLVGYDEAKAFIIANLYDPEFPFSGGVDRPKYIEYVGPVEEIDTSNIFTVDELRGDGPFSILGQIHAYHESYANKKKRGEGIIKLLAGPPGIGKSHQTLQYYLDLAKDYMVTRRQELADLRRQVLAAELDESTDDDVLERMQNRLDRFSFNFIVWFGQYVSGYADLLALNPDAEDYVFNFEARNVDNCASFDTVIQLGPMNHDVGTYCAIGCPLSEACKRSGYLAQEAKMRKYPIVYYRHNHLDVNRVQNPVKHIVIDESPTRLMDEALVIKSREVRPTIERWEVSLDDSAQVIAIELLAEAVRSAMSYNQNEPQRIEGGENPKSTVSGARFLKLLDQYIQSKNHADSLEKVIKRIHPEALQHFQPTYISGDTSQIRKRCMLQIYEAIERELEEYIREPDNDFPSCIHCIRGELHIYDGGPTVFSSNKTLVILDATALPELYETMFQRVVEVFRPEVHNPLAHIIEFKGGGFSKSYTKAQIGSGYKEINRHIATLAGDVIDPQKIPISTSLYNSRLIKEALTLIVGLVERHGELLVITHKLLRETVEWLLKGAHREYRDRNLIDRLHFAHFNEVRGTNRFAHLPAVLVLGAYRIPYEIAWCKISAWLWHMGEKLPVPKTTIIKERQFHGQESGNGIRLFDHPFAERYLDSLEEAELRQCANRIRPLTSVGEEKWVYAIGSRPALRNVTEVWSRQVLVRTLSEDKLQELEIFLRRFAHDMVNGVGEICLPPYRDITREWEVNNRTIEGMYMMLIPELVTKYPDATLHKKYRKFQEE